MMTKNNIISYGYGYDRDEKVVLHTNKLEKQFISSRKKVLYFE